MSRLLLSVTALLAGAASLSAASSDVPLDRPARVTHAVAPDYPYPSSAGFQQAPEGSVTVALTIGANGKVTSASILNSTDRALDPAALKAIYRWRFEPALRDGKPAAVTATQEFVFRLVDDAPTEPRLVARRSLR